MAKNLEQVIIDDLKDMLKENETFEYVLLGKQAPNTKRLGFIFGGWTLLLLLFLLDFLSFSWLSILLVGIGVIATVSMFYETVYIGKLGKKLYMHRFDGLKIRNQKETTLLRDVSIVYDRTSDFHLTIAVNFNQIGEFVILRRSYESKGLLRQSTNMRQLMVDIAKKQKNK